MEKLRGMRIYVYGRLLKQFRFKTFRALPVKSLTDFANRRKTWPVACGMLLSLTEIARKFPGWERLMLERGKRKDSCKTRRVSDAV